MELDITPAMVVLPALRRSLTTLTVLALPLAASAQESSLQDLGGALVAPLPPAVIYSAKEIVTLDPARPSVAAVAVAGDRILATGSLDQVRTALGRRPYRLDTTLADQVIVPGLIAQHDHPLLAGLTMTSEIIAIEDWVLPQGTAKAARNRSEYLQRLKAANDRLQDPNALLLTWGFHQYFHGQLRKADLDAISRTRPIIVWHRSAHEVYLNSAAERKYGITREWFDSLPASPRKQADFANAHYWEQGMFAVLPKLGAAIASPERIQAGLKFVRDYYHANGVTLGSEPGGLMSKPLQDAQNAVLGDSSSPFRFYFIADGKSITAKFPDAQVGAETAKLLGWGQGMTAFLPRQVKLFADGAIFSQAMQLSQTYSDGHKGEWMMDPEFFARSFRVYWDLGYQIHIHVNGDAGLDMVLNQLEANLQRNPRTNHRTVIVHFAVSRPDQVARIKRLGAIVSGNPYYPVALADNYRVHGLGPERADAMVRMGDVERAGISYSYHSDMPMAPGQPLFLVWAGVNRITNAGNLRGAEQRVSPLGALRAVTLDAAYSLRLENQLGSIVPGKLANFTILAASPLKVDPVRIKDITVWGTVQEGRVLPVRRAPGSSGISKLGPVLDQPTLASVNRADAAAHEHGHGDICTLAQLLAKAAAGGLINQPSPPSLSSRLAGQAPKP
jgi:predicted amidohydrolase YtcJ